MTPGILVTCMVPEIFPGRRPVNGRSCVEVGKPLWSTLIWRVQTVLNMCRKDNIDVPYSEGFGISYCQGVNVKTVNYIQLIKFRLHNLWWPLANSSQALYVRTRSKVPSDNFASECNLGEGSGWKCIFSWKKWWQNGWVMVTARWKLKKIKFETKKDSASPLFPFDWMIISPGFTRGPDLQRAAIQEHSDNF